MILSIRGENIYNEIVGISSITNLAEIFNRKPDYGSVPSSSYAYITIVSDTAVVNSNRGNLMKNARISFVIVCKEKLSDEDTEERVLYAIVDAINNAIVNEGKIKLNNRDGFLVNSIKEDTISPIFIDEMNRAYLVKDYIFNYLSYGENG